MKKKAQIQLGESIAIIIIVMIMIVFGMIFYAKIRGQNIGEKKEMVDEMNAVQLAQVVYTLPELQCSFAQVTDYGCIDSLKLRFLSEAITQSFQMNAQEIIEQPLSLNEQSIIFFYYREIFGQSKLTVQEIDFQGNTINTTLYEANSSWRSRTPAYMPLVIYNPITDKNSFGVLIIEKYG